MPAERDRPRDESPVQRPDGIVGREEAGVVSAATAVLSERAGTASTALPGVLADVPVAVLLIDRSVGAVTYANTAAVELAGNVRLPVDIDTWGSSVGLTDLGGQPLASTSGPLSLVAQGLPVTGEAVRIGPGRGQRDGARRDQLLWVTGFPLSRPDGDEHLSLVVFLEVDGGASDPAGAQLQALRERAVVATDIAFTITDPRRPDDPLVWVNPSFSRITGYSAEEVVGRNCRFLQGPATDPATVAEIRAALDARQAITTVLLNHRKDGTAFWNQLSISPVFDGEGELVSFVGVQTDVTERVRVEHEREAAFAAEQTARQEAELARAAAERAQADAERARADAERVQGHLALMAEATTTLIATLDLTDLLDRLARLCVPLLADWVFISLVDDGGTVRETASRHRDGFADELRLLATQHVGHLPEVSPTRRSIATSRPVLVPHAGDLDGLFSSAATREAAERLGVGSLLAVPMVARRRTRGAILLGRRDTGRPFGQEDVDLAEDLARRAALAMDNVRLYQQEHTVADTLQRSLLPQLPVIPGVESAAHYVSASTAADVGGDFYDLLHLPDGSIGVVIGDVVGHDVAAAAAMGHLRGLIRACAWEAPDPDPAAVLARVDRLVQGLGVASMATMVYARAVPPAEDGAPWRVYLASAGHPPPLLRTPDGEVQLLDGVTGLLIGVDGTLPRRSTAIDLPRAATLLAYTDGLIERPGTDLDEGIAELVERLVAAPAGAAPRQLCDAAVAGSLDGRDDVALIAVRFC
ncbi:GAF domain-containing SpoIIE family protein phosphatase [Geodermatophilus poikilotrophus]|uniref:PAS domain S-box-containing protein n=1 Tax=Geodermatophilus poikilotrophus TaxID=1333667 RepID=A0A1I0GKQ8_9ACTN|nr:GAF domain-containing SpoIIE family protein phosphatase [Geodermatophilus poikilotrophus]SET70769.1 PAS domain S-box-containing protein [Geodermatophilus poikilotrophus]